MICIVLFSMHGFAVEPLNERFPSAVNIGSPAISGDFSYDAKGTELVAHRVGDQHVGYP